MSKTREIRCYDYVNHDYEQVCAALDDAAAVFATATRAASSRAHDVASELRVDLGPVQIAKDIAINVQNVEERSGDASHPPMTRLELTWEAADSPRLFPMMNATLSIYPLTATETQLDFAGTYEPPLGWLGTVVNAVVGHRLAEVSVHRFVREVADHLRRTLD